MTTITRSGVFEGRKAYLKEPRIGSSLCVTDFLSVRDRRIAQVDDSPRAREIELAMLRAASQRRNRAEVLGPLERFAYSLISAAALTVVLVGIVSLGDSSRKGAGFVPSAQAANEVLSAYTSQSDAVRTRPN
jgi:hypothetical protein